VRVYVLTVNARSDNLDRIGVGKGCETILWGQSAICGAHLDARACSARRFRPNPSLADCDLQQGGGQAALCAASPTWCRAQVRCPEPAHAGQQFIQRPGIHRRLASLGVAARRLVPPGLIGRLVPGLRV
jgi:hypothetical protein